VEQDEWRRDEGAGETPRTRADAVPDALMPAERVPVPPSSFDGRRFTPAQDERSK
jgi:hypothetical protein